METDNPLHAGTMDRHAELIKLGLKRKATRWPGYKCLGDYCGGAYECDFVSPYTKTAGNENADVFVLLQDWCSDKTLSGPLNEDAAGLGYIPRLSTNKNLVKLLRLTFGLRLSEVYGTNLFPLIKSKGMSNRIAKKDDWVKAAREFALPQIQIITPKVVICLGLNTFNAVRIACKEVAVNNISRAIDSPFSFAMTRIWCQAHTGYWGQVNRKRAGEDRVSEDWRRMKADAFAEETIRHPEQPR
jgi:restriction system protein